MSGCSLGKSKQTSQASWWPLTLLLPCGAPWRWRVAAKGQKARTPEGAAGGRPVRWRHRPGLPPGTAVCSVAVVTPVRPSDLPGVLSAICGLSQRVMLQRGRGGGAVSEPARDKPPEVRRGGSVACGGARVGAPGRPSALCAGPVDSPGWGPWPTSSSQVILPSSAPPPLRPWTHFPSWRPTWLCHLEQKRSYFSRAGGALRRQCASAPPAGAGQSLLPRAHVPGWEGRAPGAPRSGRWEKCASPLPRVGVQAAPAPAAETQTRWHWRATGRNLGPPCHL